MGKATSPPARRIRRAANLGFTSGAAENALRLLCAEVGEFFRHPVSSARSAPRRAQRYPRQPADGERRYRNTLRHLHAGEQRVEAFEGFGHRRLEREALWAAYARKGAAPPAAAMIAFMPFFWASSPIPYGVRCGGPTWPSRRRPR